MDNTVIQRPEQDQDIDVLRGAILDKLTYSIGKSQRAASKRDWFMATALAVRDRVTDAWLKTTEEAAQRGAKRVYYLSLEFLIGRLLFDILNNAGLTEAVRAALQGLDVDLDEMRTIEPDAALGNGGLGRLAACFMESMATLGIPAHGYGIRYDHGLFRQVIKDGAQQEFPEEWLYFGNPWEFQRPEKTYEVGFGGVVDAVMSGDWHTPRVWHASEIVEAVAFDTPILGWGARHVNTLRLWSARPADPLHLDTFNQGDYSGAMSGKVRAESISKVLYPSDATPAGQELRLRQEYFFASASLQDLVRRHLKQFGNLDCLADKVAIQLNDTHPAIAVPEMMRLLVDLHNVPWDRAWETTRAIFCYTNHTLLPEALESLAVPLVERLLPRHMQIIYLLNAVHLAHARHTGFGDGQVAARVSLIDESHGRRVRMGHLAFIGSHHINGVSALHTNLMRQTVFSDLHAMYPGRINNKTNGISFRRWLHQANPGLTSLLEEVLGPDARSDAGALQRLAPLAQDRALQERVTAIKYANKVALADFIRRQLELKVDPTAMFDVQIKRIHEYKRQLMNILETVALYNDMRAQPGKDWAPRVKIFAGKAAGSYHQAKLIIKLINDVARVVNSDPTVHDRLKIVFMPNYNVSLAEIIIPAADLSEQISTAGMEASGTGNMKLALNGALTIGTLDGANVEILEHVGRDNIFIFGMTAEQVGARRQDMAENPAISDCLRDVLDQVRTGVYSAGEPDRFVNITNAVQHHDHFMVAADFDSYRLTQERVDALWRTKAAWRQASLINTAHMGWFSSDRTIQEYASELWNVGTA